MVTTEHESPIKIIRDSPEVVVQLMRLAFGVEVQSEFTIRSASEACTQNVITGTPDFEFKNDPFLPYVAEGETRGEAKAVLKVLAARGVSVPDDVRERVLACEDTEQLDRWLARASTADTADELFA